MLSTSLVRDTKPRGGVAIDGDIRAHAVDLLVRGDILQRGLAAEHVEQTACSEIELRLIRLPEAGLILRAPDPVLHLEVLDGLHLERDARYRRCP